MSTQREQRIQQLLLEEVNPEARKGVVEAFLVQKLRANSLTAIVPLLAPWIQIASEHEKKELVDALEQTIDHGKPHDLVVTPLTLNPANLSNAAIIHPPTPLDKTLNSTPVTHPLHDPVEGTANTANQVSSIALEPTLNLSDLLVTSPPTLNATPVTHPLRHDGTTYTANQPFDQTLDPANFVSSPPTLNFTPVTHPQHHTDAPSLTTTPPPSPSDFGFGGEPDLDDEEISDLEDYSDLESVDSETDDQNDLDFQLSDSDDDSNNGKRARGEDREFFVVKRV